MTGVSGSGKSALGQALVDATGARFVDADDLHSPGNVAKMRAGLPLTEADRDPWLRAVAARVAEERASSSVVLACSALRRSHRDLIRELVPDPVCLMLEPLGPGEAAATLDATRPISELVVAARDHLDRG